MNVKYLLMKKIMPLFIFVFCCFQVFSQGAKTRIAILDLSAQSGVNQSDVNGVSSMLTTALFDIGQFVIVERNQLYKVIGELGLQSTSLTQSDYARIGNVINVDFILTGDVNYALQEYNVDVRIVSVSTGQVKATAGKSIPKGGSLRNTMAELAKIITTKMPAPPPPEGKVCSGCADDGGDLFVATNDLSVMGKDLLLQREAVNGCKNKGNGWYLPSQDELSALYRNRNFIGNFFKYSYWSSSTRSKADRLSIWTTYGRVNFSDGKGDFLPFSSSNYDRDIMSRLEHRARCVKRTY
ncbi:MAG: hypothetical protein LBU91_08105 [Bacteroidales bacterium]|jgi:TolB-like protein|nr:hypothetical protein [Bacteroidales bacterium]